VWESVSGLIDRCLNEGEACYRKDDLLLYRRGPRGHFVEKYHTWSFVPLFDNETGKVLGMFNPTMETTEAVLAQRRQETLRDVAEQVQLARTTRQFFDGLAEMTARNPKDVPFLLCYSVVGEAGGAQLTLESSIGVPKDHPAAPATFDVLSSSIDPTSRPVSGGTRCVTSYDDAAWPFAQALGSRRSIVVDDCSKIIAGLPLRQWDHLPESAIVVPIWTDTSTGLPRAVLILGLNLLCPLDSAYEDWIHVLGAHLTSSLSSVRAYEAEQQRLLDKERMERAKTAWFQGAAHDIRTPLTLVAGPLEDTLATALTPKQRSSLVLAQRNVARIQRLITSLLDLSRIEAGKLSGRFVPTALGRFVEDLAALFRPAAERRQITFNVELDPSESSVYIDPLLLETVVTNLLSNALKYTEQGEITVRLAYGSHADIDVIDTGCGIPAGELEAVTDRFHRATTALARGIEGTGIGLALAKEILGLHGGELFIYSQTVEETGGPHGSTFRARIPLVERSSDLDGPEPASFGAYGKAVAADAMRWKQSDDWLGTPISETPSDSERHMVPADVLVFDATDTVLLVDDNRDMRAYIKRIFSPYCNVIEAADGEEALAIARANPPNVILSDMMMPKLDGHGLLVAIRNDPRGPALCQWSFSLPRRMMKYGLPL
jgi:signal transduction histidine kinase